MGQEKVTKVLRLYPGQEPDDAIIEWLGQFGGATRGIEGHAIKLALARGIGGGGDGNGAEAAAGAVAVDLDLEQIRRVVEAGVEAGVGRAMSRYQVAGLAEGGEDDEAEELLAQLGGALVME